MNQVQDCLSSLAHLLQLTHFSFFSFFRIFLSKGGRANCNHQKNIQVQLFQNRLEYIHSNFSTQIVNHIFNDSITHSLPTFDFSTKDSMGFSCLRTFDKCTRGQHGECGTSRDTPLTSAKRDNMVSAEHPATPPVEPPTAVH